MELVMNHVTEHRAMDDGSADMDVPSDPRLRGPSSSYSDYDDSFDSRNEAEARHALQELVRSKDDADRRAQKYQEELTQWYEYAMTLKKHVQELESMGLEQRLALLDRKTDAYVSAMSRLKETAQAGIAIQMMENEEPPQPQPQPQPLPLEQQQQQQQQQLLLLPPPHHAPLQLAPPPQPQPLPLLLPLEQQQQQQQQQPQPQPQQPRQQQHHAPLQLAPPSSLPRSSVLPKMGRVIEITGVAKDVPWDDVMTYLRDSSPEMLRMVRFGVFSDGANSQHHRFFAEFRNTVCACQAVECTIPMDSILFTTGSPHVSISRVGWIRADDGTVSMSDETKTMEGTWYSVDDIDAHETRAKVLDHTITAARDDVKVIEIKGFTFHVRAVLLKDYLGTRCHGFVGLGRLSVNKTYCRYFADFRDVGDARRAIERLDGCRLGLGLAYMGDKENPSLDRTLRCEMSPEANDQSSEMNKLVKWEMHTGLTPEKISASVTRQLLERDGKDPNHLHSPTENGKKRAHVDVPTPLARDDVKVIEIKGFAFNVRTALLKEYLGTRCHGLVGLGRLSVNKTYCRFFADFRDVGDARCAIERLDGCRLGLGLAYMGDKENPSLDRTLRCEMSPEANDQSSEMNKLAKWEKHTGLTPEKISASVTRQLLERDGKDPNHPSAIAARSGAMMPPSGDNRSKAFKSIYLGLNVQFIAEAGEVGIARLLQENGVSLIRDIKIPTISRQCAGYAFAKIPVSDADRLISMGQLPLPGPWSGNVLGVKSAMKEF